MAKERKMSTRLCPCKGVWHTIPYLCWCSGHLGYCIYPCQYPLVSVSQDKCAWQISNHWGNWLCWYCNSIILLVICVGHVMGIPVKLLCWCFSKSCCKRTMMCCFAVNASLPSARQHPSYGDSLEVKRECYQNCSVLDCVTQCSHSTAHLCEQFLQVKQIGFVTLGPLRRA